MNDLVVASYNVHRCVGLDGRRRADRIAAVIAELDADVIGLQEVDSSAGIEHGHDQLAAIADAAGYRCVAGPTLRRHDGHTGNALLTRLPIDASRLIDLSIRGREPRGAIDVELDAAPWRVRVVVTHFGLRAAERREQCERLLALLAPRDEDAAILLGDFNEWLAPARLLRRIHRTFGRARGVRSWPSPCPVLALDRIWARPEQALRGLRAHRSRRARVASDHLPIRGVLALAGREVGRRSAPGTGDATPRRPSQCGTSAPALTVRGASGMPTRAPSGNGAARSDTPAPWSNLQTSYAESFDVCRRECCKCFA